MSRKIQVVFPDRLLEIVDRIVREIGFHKSRSDFIVEAVRDKVRSEYALKGENKVVKKFEDTLEES